MAAADLDYDRFFHPGNMLPHEQDFTYADLLNDGPFPGPSQHSLYPGTDDVFTTLFGQFAADHGDFGLSFEANKGQKSLPSMEG